MMIHNKMMNAFLRGCLVAVALAVVPQGSDAANVKVTKIANVTSPFEGDTVKYTIRIQNTSTNQNSNAFTVHDVLPNELRYISSVSSISAASYDTSLDTWIIPGPFIQQRLDSLVIVTVVKTGTEGMTITNTAYKGLNNNDAAADDTDRVSITVVSQPPTITSASPSSGTRVQGASIKLGGSHFVQGATLINFGPGITALSATVSSPDTMTVNIYVAAGAPTGSHDIIVTNPPPGGGSDTLFAGFSVVNPIPVLTTINPAIANSQDPQFTLTVNGSKFVPGATVTANGSNRTTTFIDSSKVQATIPATDLLVPGVIAIKVTNPGPGGGTSAATDTLTVKATADLSVQKTLGPLKKDTLTYVLTVRNLGPNDATGASVKDVLPGSVVFISTSSTVTGQYNNGTHVWTIGNLAVGDSALCTIVTRLANPNASGITITNIANTLTAAEFDRVPTNNADSVSLVIKILRPGDTNNDLLVDARDIVEIGLCYGISGPPRSGTADTLQQYLASGWNTVSSPEVCAFADCNGNGVVDSGDVWTIVSNWGRSSWTGEIEPASNPIAASKESIIRQMIASARELPAGKARDEILGMLQQHLHDIPSQPIEWSLRQNYPNPFNGETSIGYSVPQLTGVVKLTIYDVLGRVVKTFERFDVEPGVYEMRWDGTGAAGTPVASGFYVYRLQASGATMTRKLLYVR